jgi:hypothetical protein
MVFEIWIIFDTDDRYPEMEKGSMDMDMDMEVTNMMVGGKVSYLA